MSNKKKKKRNDHSTHETKTPSRYEQSLERFHRKLLSHCTFCDPNVEFPTSTLPPGITRHLYGKASNLIFAQGPAGCGKTSAVVGCVQEVCKDRSREQDFLFHISLRDICEVFTLEDRLDIVDFFAFADSHFYKHTREEVRRHLTLLQDRIILIMDDVHEFRYPLGDNLPVIENSEDKVAINVLIQNIIRGDWLQDILKICIQERMLPCFRNKTYSAKVIELEHHFNLDAFLEKYAGQNAKTIRDVIDNCDSFNNIRNSPVTALDLIEEFMIQFGKGESYSKAINKERSVLLGHRHTHIFKSDGEELMDFFHMSSEYIPELREDDVQIPGIKMNFKFAPMHRY